MQNFTKRIAIEKSFKPEFFFNRIYTVSGIRYHVSVIDRDSQTVAFNMEEKNGNWKIINAPKIPDWIIAIEKKLEEEIFKNSVD